MKRILSLAMVLGFYHTTWAGSPHTTQNNSCTAQWHFNANNSGAEDWVLSMISTDKKEYICVGWTYKTISGTSTQVPVYFKLDHLGNLVWINEILSATGTNYSVGNVPSITSSGASTPVTVYPGGNLEYVAKGRNGKYAATGLINGKILLVEFDENGNLTPATTLPEVWNFYNTSTSTANTVTLKARCLAMNPNGDAYIMAAEMNGPLFVEKVDCSGSTPVQSNAIVSGGGYSGQKILTRDNGSGDYDIFICGRTAGPNWQTIAAGTYTAPDGTSPSFAIQDEDIYVLKMLGSNLSVETSTTYNKSNMKVSGGVYGPLTNSDYVNQETGPVSARSYDPSTQEIDGSQIAGQFGEDVTSASPTQHNYYETATDMVFMANGDIAMTALVNFISIDFGSPSSNNLMGNSSDRFNDNSHGRTTYYDEYIDGDGFLMEINPSDLSLKQSAKNVGHFSGADFRLRLTENSTGNNNNLNETFLIAGSTADYYDGTNPNLVTPRNTNAFVVYSDMVNGDYWKRDFAGEDDMACIFAVDGTADGGFVIAGNNCTNGDDYTVTKYAPLYAPSLVMSNQIYKFGSSYIPDIHTVSGVETWSTDMNVASQVIIPAGATLNITNCNIRFASSDHMWDYNEFPGSATTGKPIGITVQPGGKLNITNAYLSGMNTAYTYPFPNVGVEMMWDGIVVQGTPTAVRSLGNQGHLTMNNAHIQNARYGILVTDGNDAYKTNAKTVGDFSSNLYNERYGSSGGLGGGIVNASNSSFENCRFGVNYQIYSQTPVTYPSSFANCTFDSYVSGMGDVCTYADVNGNAMPASSYFAVWAVDRIHLTDNTFTSSFNGDLSIQPNGVIIQDAAMDINASATGVFPTYTYGSGNSFENLRNGIIAQYSAGNNSRLLNISRNTFDNNLYGLSVQGSIAGLTFTNNNVKVPNASGSNKPIGVNLAGCSEYKDADNTFDKCSTCGGTVQSTGINVNTGKALTATYDNVVQSNTFNNLAWASTANQINATSDGKQGLQFHCNIYNAGSGNDVFRSSIDQTTGTTIPATMRGSQGSNSSGAAGASNNEFVNSCTGINYLNEDSWVSQVVTYWYNGTTYEDPSSCSASKYNPQHTAYTSDHMSECPEPFTVDGGGPYHISAPHSFASHAKMVSLDSTINNTDTANPIYPDLISQRNLLIDDYVMNYNFGGYDDSAAKMLEYYKRFASAFSFYMHEQSWTDAGRMLDSVKLNNGDDSLFRYLGAKALTLYSTGKNWLNLDSTAKDSLTRVAQVNHMAGYMAGTISSIIGNGVLQWPVPLYGQGNKETPIEKTAQVTELSVYPNPTTGMFNVNAPASGLLYVYNMEGVQIGNYKLAEGKNVLALPGAISPGIYIGKYMADGNAVKNEVIRLVYQP